MFVRHAKAHAVPKDQAVVVVAATNTNVFLTILLFCAAFLLFVLPSPLSYGAVLPEERADVMYHRYEGGGMVIDGPSLLVRKNIKDKVSLAANYYVDSVSSASIDVLTQGASRYSEERTEYSFDAAYLTGKTQFNLGFTQSDENDYEAQSIRFDISHAFFSEMTTIGIGYSQGDDDISSTTDEDLSETLQKRSYRFNASQILSKNLIVNLNYEGIIDEGYLQNPYRQIIEVGCNIEEIGFSSCAPNSRLAGLAAEAYPTTRNSDAFSLKFSYHLPWEAALKTRLGYFSDSWDIESYSIEFDYSHRVNERLIADFRVRYYDQSQAFFYANQFDVSGPTIPEFRGRDKELSQHNSYSVGAGFNYRIELDKWVTDVSLNGQIDYFRFNYDNFLEYRDAINASTDILGAPRYSFGAYALRIFATARF